MRSLARFALLTAAATAFAACGEVSDPVAPMVPNLAVGGASGCYTIDVVQTFTPTGPTTFAGSISGDLEGSVTQEFDTVNPLHGTTNTSSGIFTWTITGGIVPELIGKTFTTRIYNRNIFFPDRSLIIHVGTSREIAGVEKVNFNHQGRTHLPASQIVIDFGGVICP